MQGRDTGYRVGSSKRQTSKNAINPRLIIAGVIGILLVLLLVFGISSCVRSCSAPKQQKADETKEVNAQDPRVAAGVPAEETSKLSAVLDRNETFEKLAAKADKIDDERLIDLAIEEPESIAFVYGSIKADGTAQPYADAAAKGEYPQIYTFDKRWGYVEFGDGIMGVTGSGPVALSIASMGLSGKTTYDPATIAEAVTAAKLATGTSGMDDAFVTEHGAEAGVVATSVEASSDGMYSPIAEMSQPVLIKLKSDSGIGSATSHWAVITGINSDNSISLNDPTSVYATGRSYSLGNVAANTESAFALSASVSSAGTNTDDADDATATATATDDASMDTADTDAEDTSL